MWILGLVQAVNRRIASHKDCMIASALFAMVPTGLARFGRDALQWYLGDTCNVAKSADFIFFVVSVNATIGWPLLYKLSKRWSVHAVFPFFLAVNISMLVVAVLIARPKLSGDPCLWEALPR